MWAEAPDEVDWETAHVACDPNRSVPYPLTAQEALEPCVSAWDGRHEGFEQLIKDELNDPGSMDTHGLYFNPQEGTGKGTVRLQLDYSAANAFGGKVRYKAVALMDVESCEIVEVVTFGW